MSGERKRGRPTHEVETVEFKVTTTRVVLEDLKRLVASGYFGKSYNEAAEQFVRERLREMLGDDEWRQILRPSS